MQSDDAILSNLPHCVMLLALLCFLEFPIFLFKSHFTKVTRRKMNFMYPNVDTHSKKSMTILGHVDIRFLKFLLLVCVAAPGTDV